MREHWKIIALGSAAVCMLGLAGCGSDNDNNSAPAGVYKLNLAGGTGGTADGGTGGDIYIDNYTDVKVLRSGSVNANFTVPTYAKNFGEFKATISADTIVQLDVDAVGGGYYMITNDTNLYLGDGDGVLANFPDTDDTIVTGLQVNAGKTIQFPNNYTSWGTWSYVWFDNAVIIDGTATVVTEGNSLEIASGSLLQINASGKVTTTTTTAGTDSGAIYLYSDGVLVNKGSVTADAAADASAASVELDGYTFVFNTGNMSANGGHSTTSSGGSAGDLYLYSYYAGLFSSGDLTANGGNGGAGDGGQGGYLYLEGGYEQSMGDTYVSGNLTANGGNGTDGNGGSADYVYIYNSSGGDLKVNADISAAGGAGNGASYSGGSGAYCYIETYSYGYDYGYGEYAPMGDIEIAGNFNLAGGNGAAAGGSGGDLTIEGYETYDQVDPTKRASTITLAGFNAINISGGNSTDASGGDAGYYEIYTEDASNDYPYLPTGAIVNEATVSGKGGNGAINGGMGGWVEFEAEGEAYVGSTIVKNTAAIDLSGGTGDSGGDAGGIYFYGHDGVMNTASITANGGNGITQGGDGAYWNIEMYATLDINNTGDILANGGSGETAGDGSGYVALYAGGQVNNSGQIKTFGGNGSTDGGSGGYIDLFSQTRPTANSGQLNVAKGTGGTTAVNGEILIDWVDVTPTSGIL